MTGIPDFPCFKVLGPTLNPKLLKHFKLPYTEKAANLFPATGDPSSESDLRGLGSCRLGGCAGTLLNP